MEEEKRPQVDRVMEVGRRTGENEARPQEPVMGLEIRTNGEAEKRAQESKDLTMSKKTRTDGKKGRIE